MILGDQGQLERRFRDSPQLDIPIAGKDARETKMLLVESGGRFNVGNLDQGIKALCVHGKHLAMDRVEDTYCLYVEW
jgi:hypothetical protein